MEIKRIVVNDIIIDVAKTGEIFQEGRLLKPRLNRDGYPVVSVKNSALKKYRSYTIHRLVALAWIKNDDPIYKTEVNHKDFDRTNYNIENLEWINHVDNVRYSRKAGRYPLNYGVDNPNYGNITLHKRYARDKELAKLKQSRPGARNGKAKRCKLFYKNDLIGEFGYQRAAAYKLQELERDLKNKNIDNIIRRLKQPNGFMGYHLINDNISATFND